MYFMSESPAVCKITFANETHSNTVFNNHKASTAKNIGPKPMCNRTGAIRNKVKILQTEQK